MRRSPTVAVASSGIIRLSLGGRCPLSLCVRRRKRVAHSKMPATPPACLGRVPRVPRRDGLLARAPPPGVSWARWRVVWRWRWSATASNSSSNQLGFWHYPSDNTGRGPLLMYSVLVLMFAVLSLIGWRVVRRLGRRGEAVFFIPSRRARCAAGLLRGRAGAGDDHLAPGLTTVLVDMGCWAGLTALAQGVMRLVAGPARADPLARQAA